MRGTAIVARLDGMSDPRAALEAIGVLPDVEIDIGDAALQLARVDAPDADWQAARAHLSELARDAVELADTIGTNDLSVRAEALAGLIAGRYAYAGDAETYDDLANANLISVIRRRKGLPVALGIIWLHTARAAGVPLRLGACTGCTRSAHAHGAVQQPAQSGLYRGQQGGPRRSRGAHPRA